MMLFFNVYVSNAGMAVQFSPTRNCEESESDMG